MRSERGECACPARDDQFCVVLCRRDDPGKFERVMRGNEL